MSTIIRIGLFIYTMICPIVNKKIIILGISMTLWSYGTINTSLTFTMYSIIIVIALALSCF